MNRMQSRIERSFRFTTGMLLPLVLAVVGAVSFAAGGDDPHRTEKPDLDGRIADFFAEVRAAGDDFGNEDRARRIERKFDELLKAAHDDGARLIADVVRYDREHRDQHAEDIALAIGGTIVRLLPHAKDDRKNTVRTALPPDEAAHLTKRMLASGHALTTRLQREGKPTLTIGMGILYTIGQLQGLTTGEELIAVLPALLEIEDDTLRRDVHRLLDETACGTRRWNFTMVRDLLRKRDGDIDPHLVEYLLLRNPGEAMPTLASILEKNDERRTSLLLAFRTVDTVRWKSRHRVERPLKFGEDEKSALLRLSRSEHWWARLYAAQAVRQEPALRLSEAIERLHADEHPLIRKEIKSVRDFRREGPRFDRPSG